MGIIEKSIRNRGNRKLAAPLTTTTSSSAEEVVEAIRRLCRSHNANSEAQAKTESERAQSRGFFGKMSSEESAKAWLRSRFYLSERDAGVLIGYGRKPEDILALQGKRLSSTANHWLASVTFPDPEMAGCTTVEVTLLKWITDKNGRMQSRGHYEGFCDELFDAIRADTPDKS
jgi:hypothetical protein